MVTKLYKEQKVEKSKVKRFLTLIFVITLVCGAIMAVAWKLNDNDFLDPDENVKKIETNAETMRDEGDAKLVQESGGGAASLSYTKVVTVDLNTKQIHMLFGNPSRSNYNAVVQVMVEGEVIGMSGRLEPGYQVRELPLDKDVELFPGKYEGKLQIYFYDPVTFERAMVNSAIPVTIEAGK